MYTKGNLDNVTSQSNNEKSYKNMRFRTHPYYAFSNIDKLETTVFSNCRFEDAQIILEFSNNNYVLFENCDFLSSKFVLVEKTKIQKIRFNRCYFKNTGVERRELEDHVGKIEFNYCLFTKNGILNISVIDGSFSKLIEANFCLFNEHSVPRVKDNVFVKINKSLLKDANLINPHSSTDGNIAFQQCAFYGKLNFLHKYDKSTFFEESYLFLNCNVQYVPNCNFNGFSYVIKDIEDSKMYLRSFESGNKKEAFYFDCIESYECIINELSDIIDMTTDIEQFNKLKKIGSKVMDNPAITLYADMQDNIYPRALFHAFYASSG